MMHCITIQLRFVTNAHKHKHQSLKLSHRHFKQVVKKWTSYQSSYQGWAEIKLGATWLGAWVTLWCLLPQEWLHWWLWCDKLASMEWQTNSCDQHSVYFTNVLSTETKLLVSHCVLHMGIQGMANNDDHHPATSKFKQLNCRSNPCCAKLVVLVEKSHANNVLSSLEIFL